MAKKKKASKAAAKKAPKKTAAKRAGAKPKRAAAAASMRLTGVETGFTVGDIQKSLAFYRDVLGFAENERWDFDGRLSVVQMAAGDVTLMLGQDDWKKGRDRVKGEGFRVYCETTQNIDTLAERIKANGGALEHEPREGWGRRSLSVTDPDGFRLTFWSKLKKA